MHARPATLQADAAFYHVRVAAMGACILSWLASCIADADLGPPALVFLLRPNTLETDRGRSKVASLRATLRWAAERVDAQEG